MIYMPYRTYAIRSTQHPQFSLGLQRSGVGLGEGVGLGDGFGSCSDGGMLAGFGESGDECR